MKTYKTYTLMLLLIALLVSSCASPLRAAMVDTATPAPTFTTAPSETPTMEPTATMAMRATPTPMTPLPTFTWTPLPTLTPIRTPAPTWNGVVVPTAVPVPVATSPALDANGGYYDYAAALEIVRLTNEFRVQNGKKPLAIDERLMDIARKRAKEIVKDFSHSGIVSICGECWENLIGWTIGSSPQFLMNQWMASDGHKNNILRVEHYKIGAGVYKTNTGVFSALELVDPNGTQPLYDS